MFKQVGPLIIHDSGDVYNENNVLYKKNLYKDKRAKQSRIYILFKRGTKYKRLYVDHLVATLFVPNPNLLPHIYHIDGNIHNCEAINLEWVDFKSRRFKEKYSNTDIFKYLHTLNQDNLQSVNLAIYKYLLKDQLPLIQILNEKGNQRYIFGVIKNEFKRLTTYSDGYINRLCRMLVDYTNESILSLIERGYYLPLENADGVFWIYVRETAKGNTKMFLRNISFREKLGISDYTLKESTNFNPIFEQSKF